MRQQPYARACTTTHEPGLHSDTCCRVQAGCSFGTTGKGQSPCGCAACNFACVQARCWGCPSLPSRPQLERLMSCFQLGEGRVHRGRERAPLCLPVIAYECVYCRCIAFKDVLVYKTGPQGTTVAPPRGIPSGEGRCHRASPYTCGRERDVVGSGTRRAACQ